MRTFRATAEEMLNLEKSRREETELGVFERIQGWGDFIVFATKDKISKDAIPSLI